MYTPGIAASLLIVLLVCTAGCTLIPGTPNPAVKQGTGEQPAGGVPTLPELYTAPGAVPAQAVLAAAAASPSPDTLPRLFPAQQMTINGSGLNTTNSSSGTVRVTPTGTNPPVAQFTADPVTGYAPLLVRFTDTSLNLPTAWSWDFGEGSSSFLQNPSRTFSNGGIYKVRLTAANAGGSTSYTRNISVYKPDFSVTPPSGTAPLSVTFSETGFGSPEPTSFFWIFGDGTTCTARTKVHQYTAPGTYDVGLRISGLAGTTWVNRSAAVIVT